MSLFSSFFSFNRIHLFEIEDQSWLPKSLRNGVTDFLQHIVQVYSLYQPITNRLMKALHRSNQSNILDLCSGGNGPWVSLAKKLPDESNQKYSITLTDLYPNQFAIHRSNSLRYGNIKYLSASINALQVPKELKGFRTLFSSFHHLNPTQAQTVLKNAVEAKSGIAIFESTQRHPLSIIYMLFTPLIVLINTPFIRPFRWSRIFWTYFIPLIPLIVAFDGIISCLRTYSVEELKEMARKINAPNYHWEIGLEKIGFLPIGVTYLIGYEKK